MSSSGCISFTVIPELDSGFFMVGVVGPSLLLAFEKAGNVGLGGGGPPGPELVGGAGPVGRKSGPTGAEEV